MFKLRSWRSGIGISAAVVVVAAATAVYGSVPHTFNVGDTLQAADLNGDFAALDQRLAALEAAKSSATVVMDNVVGPLPAAPGKTAAFSSSGGVVVLIVSGTAYGASMGTTMDVAVTVDGLPLGDLKAVTNEANSHRALPSKSFSIPGLKAGAHTLGLALVGGITDAADLFNATVLELGH